MTVEEVEKIQKTLPNLSLVMIFQTTKDGMFRGQNTWEHLVQTVIEVKNGIAKTGKNRFGAKGSYRIFDDDFYPDLNDDENEYTTLMMMSFKNRFIPVFFIIK